MEHVYSVQEITGIIKSLFEQHFESLRISGEISNCRPSSTGHLYFTLKDEKASLQAVMFKGRSWTLGFEPKDGLKVVVSGSLSVYEQRGSYQIIVESMERSGEGDILRMLEERKQKLAREGLFDHARKRAVPFFPLRIAVITSPTGAALRDILTVLSRRNSTVSVTVLPAPVQGVEAAPALIRQVETANRYCLADLIIIGRGGGSLEDLLPFSDEGLVRAVAASNIPVISAVGHEIDWALTDFAADVRAPTPSAAAELAVPVLEEITEAITRRRSDMLRSMSGILEKLRLNIKSFTSEALELQFRRIEQPLLLRLDDAKEALLYATQARLIDAKHTVALLAQTIAGANPQDILKRGYAIVSAEKTGRILRTAKEAAAAHMVRVRLFDGEITALVKDT